MKFANDEIAGRMKKYQKRLIPVNVAICTLCIVVILTLFFCPLIKINVAKMLTNQEIKTMFNNTMQDALPKPEEGENNSTEAEVVASLDLEGIVEPLVISVLDSFSGKNISLSMSVSDLMAMSLNGENEIQKFVDRTMFDEKDGFVPSLIKAIKGVFDDEDVVNTVQHAVVDVMADSTLDSLKTMEDAPPELVEKINAITDDDLKTITDKLYAFDTVESETDVKKVVADTLDAVEAVLDFQFEAEQKQAVEDMILDIYNDVITKMDGATDANGQPIKFSLETMICVMLSSSEEFSIDDINAMLNSAFEEKTSSTNRYETAAATLEGSDGKTDGTQTDGSQSGTQTGSTENKEIYYSYSQISNAIDTTGLEQGLRKQVNDMFGTDSTDGMGQYISYAFYAFAAFIGIWFIQFLFAFIHIFCKNKRCMMWYTKLLGWIPAIIWLALTLVTIPALTSLIAGMIGEIAAGVDTAAVIKGLLSGITSFTWVCGLCYLLLWLVSIFWAFPIKHKIRKTKKENKRLLKAAR